MVQSRRIVGGSDADAPQPGFTTQQYATLALCYVVSSVRRGQWLIPAFHCVLDLIISGGHDDAQNFDLGAWDTALGTLLNSLTLPGTEGSHLGLGVEPITNKPGFQVPSKSAALVHGIDFNTAESVGTNFVGKFMIADGGGDPIKGSKDTHTDQTRCERILRFPDGTIFFSAKMAIDSDGSPRATTIDQSGGPGTSLLFRDGQPVNAETIPYVVLPQLDKFT